MVPTVLCATALFFCSSFVTLCTETEEAPKIRRICEEIEKDKEPASDPIVLEV